MSESDMGWYYYGLREFICIQVNRCGADEFYWFDLGGFVCCVVGR